MTSFLQLSTVVAPENLRGVFEFAFCNDFFVPVAVGCRSPGKTDQWLLIGYAPNTFLERQIRGRKVTSHVVLDTEHSPNAVVHLKEMTSRILAWQLPRAQFSGFERVDLLARASFVSERVPAAGCVASLSAWLARHPASTIHFAGCVKLEGTPADLAWDSAFRQLVISDGAPESSEGEGVESAIPFLELVITPDHRSASEGYVFSAYSGSDVWIEGLAAASTSAALTNLELSHFMRKMSTLGNSSELMLEGRSFQMFENELRFSFGL